MVSSYDDDKSPWAGQFGWKWKGRTLLSSSLQRREVNFTWPKVEIKLRRPSFVIFFLLPQVHIQDNDAAFPFPLRRRWNIFRLLRLPAHIQYIYTQVKSKTMGNNKCTASVTTGSTDEHPLLTAFKVFWIVSSFESKIMLLIYLLNFCRWIFRTKCEFFKELQTRRRPIPSAMTRELLAGLSWPRGCSSHVAKTIFCLIQNKIKP